MIPLEQLCAANNVCGDLKNGVMRVDNLNDLLQQQIVVDNVARAGVPLSATESQCLDLQTGKISADDILECSDTLADNSENVAPVQARGDYASVQNDPVLTDEQKIQIKQETGWADEVVDHIQNIEQYDKVFKNANLKEVKIANRTCLVKTDIDPNYVDPKTGLTNAERMAKGRSLIDYRTGEKIELHHMGQDKDGPLVELCENSEHGDGNHHILHPQTDNSWRHDPGAVADYERERIEHWQERAKEFQHEYV